MKRPMTLTIDRAHWGTKAACALMGLAAVLRLVYFVPARPAGIVLWGDLLLPLLASLCFLAAIGSGRAVKGGCLAAVALGVAFFLVRARTLAPVHRGLCTLLYLMVFLLFYATVLGFLPTKKLLFPLFGLPFLYHLFVEDPKLYFFAHPPVPVWDWLPELSVLCIMAALFFLTFGMKCEKR